MEYKYFNFKILCEDCGVYHARGKTPYEAVVILQKHAKEGCTLHQNEKMTDSIPK